MCRSRSLWSPLVAGLAFLLIGNCLTDRIQAADPPAGMRIHIANADGSEPRLLTKELEEYDGQGSPDWSQDGKFITFDAWRESDGETYADSRIVVVEVDSGKSRVLIDGAMPSFSPGAHRIAFSRYGSHNGVWGMNSEDPEEGLALIDKAGWGTAWSPDGRTLAYTRGGNIVLLDVIEGTRRSVFDKMSSPYSRIYWNFRWSPDSQSLVFKGLRNGKIEVAIVSAQGAKHGLIRRYQGTVASNLAWSPDGERILISKRPPGGGATRLFALDPNTTAPPKLLPGQKPGWNYPGVAYSPDGKKLAIPIRLPE